MGRQRHPPTAAQPHPFKATAAHAYWFIDGRMMDFALDGVRWWSLILLEGYSRTIVAGAVAPSEASWVALMVLYTACRRSGVPEFLISDSGGAFTSHAFAAVCHRFGIEHKPMDRTQLPALWGFRTGRQHGWDGFRRRQQPVRCFREPVSSVLGGRPVPVGQRAAAVAWS